jgi:anaerobic dimethyl sulfoxide reductase subunit A
MTPSARYADIVLPATTWFERNDIAMPWAFGDYALFLNQVIEPLHEARSAYDWVADLAGRFGLREAFTEGKTDLDWLRQMTDEARVAWPEFPDFETFRQRGVYKYRHPEPFIAFQEQVEQGKPFPTPSGKIELYSPRLAAMDRPGEIPAIPRYIPAWEGPADPLRSHYPLQCIGWHYKRRCHSIYDNVDVMEEAGPQEAWINPADAARRRIRTGDRVRVFNDRGALVIPARVTPRVMPGVVAIPQGAWWEPDKDGTDRGGSLNVLTSLRPTPLAHANAQHTMIVQIERAR